MFFHSSPFLVIFFLPPGPPSERTNQSPEATRQIASACWRATWSGWARSGTRTSTAWGRLAQPRRVDSHVRTTENRESRWDCGYIITINQAEYGQILGIHGHFTSQNGDFTLWAQFDFRDVSHLQPLAPVAAVSGCQVAASGCKWLQVAASGWRGKWLQVAASGCKWLQVAASGCKWLQVADSGCKWLPSGCKWLQVADGASGCKWLQVAASGWRGKWQPVWLQVAAKRLQVADGASGCKWLQVAASGCKWLPSGWRGKWLQVADGASGCEWLQVAASGCKWLQMADGASGCKWLPSGWRGKLLPSGCQVAASGCKWVQVAAKWLPSAILKKNVIL